MPLTCREYLLRGAEDPQKLRGLFCRATRGVSEIAASYGRQRENVEQLRPPCSRCGKPLLLTRNELKQPGVETSHVLLCVLRCRRRSRCSYITRLN
jgi:hypothetical protein